MTKEELDRFEQAMGIARAGVKKIGDVRDAVSKRLTPLAVAAVDTLDAASKAKDRADKRVEMIVQQQAGVTRRIQNDAEAAVTPIRAPGDRIGYVNAQSQARAKVADAVTAQAREEAKPEANAAQQAAVAASAACSAFQAQVTQEKVLVGVDDPGSATSDDAAADSRLAMTLGSKPDAEIAMLYDATKTTGEEDDVARFRRVAGFVLVDRKRKLTQIPRPTRAQALELGTCNSILQKIAADRMDDASAAIAAAEDLLELLRAGVWQKYFGFDARNASPETMAKIRSSDRLLDQLQRPWSIDPTLGEP